MPIWSASAGQARDDKAVPGLAACDVSDGEDMGMTFETAIRLHDNSPRTVFLNGESCGDRIGFRPGRPNDVRSPKHGSVFENDLPFPDLLGRRSDPDVDAEFL